MKIKFKKSWMGIRSMTINNKVNFFIGISGRVGFEISYDKYDRSFNLLIICWFMGVDVYHNE